MNCLSERTFLLFYHSRDSDATPSGAPCRKSCVRGMCQCRLPWGREFCSWTCHTSLWTRSISIRGSAGIAGYSKRAMLRRLACYVSHLRHCSSFSCHETPSSIALYLSFGADQQTKSKVAAALVATMLHSDAGCLATLIDSV